MLVLKIVSIVNIEKKVFHYAVWFLHSWNSVFGNVIVTVLNSRPGIEEYIR